MSLPTDVVLMTAVKGVQMPIGGGSLHCMAAADQEQPLHHADKRKQTW